MPAVIASTLDYPAYAVTYSDGTGDHTFFIVNMIWDGQPRDVTSSDPALSGDISTGSFEKGLLEAVKTFITGKGYTMDSIMQYTDVPNDVSAI